MRKFVHVSFVFGDPPTPHLIARLEKKFDRAFDWMRYSDAAWILYTARTINSWRDTIGQVKLPENTVFMLVEFDHASKCSGYQHEWVWEWLEKKRD